MEGAGNDLIVALGLVLALEGALYALAPRAMKAMLEQVGHLDEETMRRGGLAALAVGVLVVWAMRG